MGIQRGVHSSMLFWGPSNILERSSRNVNVEGFEFEYLKGLSLYALCSITFYGSERSLAFKEPYLEGMFFILIEECIHQCHFEYL